MAARRRKPHAVSSGTDAPDAPDASDVRLLQTDPAGQISAPKLPPNSATGLDEFRFIDRAVRAARGRRRPQAAAENRALHKLAECANGEPRDVLQGLLSLAAELVGGGEATSTAGVSLLETGADGEEQFRWVALVGRLGAHMGEATPRDYSPCGECLNHGEPIVLARPDLKYTYFLASGTEFTEGLIVPFGTSADAAPIGTIWVVSHPPERRCFDDEDVRMMVSLGSFASSAYHMAEGREIAQRASRAQLSPGDVDARRSADVADRLAQAIDGAADGREPPPDDADVAAVDSGDAGDQGVWRSTAAAAPLEPGSPLYQRILELRHLEEGSVVRARQRDIAERMLVSALREQALSDENAHLYQSANLARVTAEKAQSHAEWAQALAESARREAEAANSAKAQFLANMSHELRTPLNAIAGYTQLLEMGVHGPITEEQRDALIRIDRAQRYLLRLVNDVLNLARLQAERVVYAVEPLNIAEVVAEVDALISPQLHEKELAYTVNVSPDRVALGDREKLVQVLLNLLSNAVKFTQRGGAVTVECAERADGSGDPNLVYVRVRDTGLGIAREKLEHIFEPFVQVDTTAAGRAAGAGLGLAISRDLARGMGGDLRARSTPGLGSAFTIQLPAAP